MNTPALPLLPLEQFYAQEKTLAKKIYLRQPIDGQWIEYSWETVGREARRFARAIEKLNFPPRSCIAILSKNCAHWIIADLGIWMAGHISVPLYPTSSNESIQYVLNHCEAKLLIAGKLDDWKTQRNAVPQGMPVVSFPFWKNEGAQLWADFLGADFLNPSDANRTAPSAAGASTSGTSAGASTVGASFVGASTSDASAGANKDENRTRGADEIATVIYTSGTTGNPKGVVHTFRSISVHLGQAIASVGLGPQDKFFSYLPLSHVAERLLIELGSLYTGGEVSFAETIDSFKKNLKEVRPTIFLAVPRIWLKFQQGILQKIPQKKLTLLLAIPLLGNFIRHKIKKELGLDRVHVVLTGAAAISKELLIWFDCLGITIQEVYGMTENFCISTFNFPGKIHFGTVGTVWPHTETKIGPNHEILTRSASNMLGYYKEPELTAETIDSEGWIHTGDQGEFDQDGYLKITGRVKDLFKTSKGKYVAPTKIETHFEMHEVIEQVCVLGSGLPQPIALVILSEVGKVLAADAVTRTLEEILTDVNEKIESYERLDHLVVLSDTWNVETGLLTPTLKIKRNIIEKKYAPLVERWSAARGKVILHK